MHMYSLHAHAQPTCTCCTCTDTYAHDHLLPKLLFYVVTLVYVCKGWKAGKVSWFVPFWWHHHTYQHSNDITTHISILTTSPHISTGSQQRQYICCRLIECIREYYVLLFRDIEWNNPGYSVVVSSKRGKPTPASHSPAYADDVIVAFIIFSIHPLQFMAMMECHSSVRHWNSSFTLVFTMMWTTGKLCS